MIMAAITEHKPATPLFKRQAGGLSLRICASKPLTILKRVTSINLWIGSREWEKLG
jgi:hypothetical protein